MAAAGGTDGLSKAQEMLVVALGNLHEAEEADPVDELRVAKAEHRVAKAELGVAKAELKAAAADEKANVELGVAKAELGVAKAELGVAEAKWEAAKGDDKAVFQETLEAARASVRSAQAVLETANIAYKNALQAAAPPHGADDGGALVGPLEAFLKEQQERDERQRKEQQERDERQRKEQQERDERQRKEQQERDERQRKEQQERDEQQRKRDEQQRKEQMQMLRHLSRPENPWAEMARTSAASDTSSQKDFRTRLSTFYGHGESQKPKCIVTGVEDAPDSFRVVAAHIWPRSAAETFPFKTLENGVNNPSNGMFLHQTIEQDMDRLRVCFVCDPFQISAKFVVLHKGILEQNLQGTKFKYSELHLKNLKFTNEQRPSFQLLSKHAQQAFNHSGNDLSMNEQDVDSFKAVLQVGSPQKPSA